MITEDSPDSDIDDKKSSAYESIGWDGDPDNDLRFYPNPGVDVYFDDSDDAEVFMLEESYSVSDDETSSTNGSCDESSSYCVSPNGIKWNSSAPVNRRLQRDMINFHEGAKVNPDDEVSAFQLFFTELMLRSILRLTNRRMRAKRQKVFTFEEFTAAIGIIIRSGADKSNL